MLNMSQDSKKGAAAWVDIGLAPNDLEIRSESDRENVDDITCVIPTEQRIKFAIVLTGFGSD